MLSPFSVSADLTEKLISQLVVPSKAWLDQHVRARFMCHISNTHTHTEPTTHTIHTCVCSPAWQPLSGKYSKFETQLFVQIFITHRINFNMRSEIKGLGLTELGVWLPMVHSYNNDEVERERGREIKKGRPLIRSVLDSCIL